MAGKLQLGDGFPVRQLCNQLSTGGSWSVSTYSVNGSGDSQVPYSMSQKAYVMVPDQSTVDTAKQMIQDLYDGK